MGQTILTMCQNFIRNTFYIFIDKLRKLIACSYIQQIYDVFCLYVYLPEEAYMLIELVQINFQASMIQIREYTTIHCDIEIVITCILK